jgi:subtilisin family serine protease
LKGHRKLKQSDNSKGIDSQYIIHFDSSTIQNATAKTMSLMQGMGDGEKINVLYIYDSVFKGASISGVSSFGLRQILDDDDVLYLEQDEIVELGTTEDEEYNTTLNFYGTSASSINFSAGVQALPTSWGLDRIDQASLPLDKEYTFGAATGKGVTVFVLDSGVRLSHHEFQGRASCSLNLVADEDCDDSRGHGTVRRCLINPCRSK